MPFYRVGDVGLLFGATAALAVDLAASPSPPPPPPPPPPPSGNIEVSLTASRTSGTAPLAVHFDAIATTADIEGVSDTFRQLLYTFNYGDDESGTWPISGLSKNQDVGGPIGAHVFETPGTYTVRCTATRGDESNFQEVTITVADPDTVYAGTNTVFVSPSGNYAGAPSGAETATSIPTIVSNRRYILRRGESFGSLNIPHGVSGTQVVASAGVDAKPQLTSVQIGAGTQAPNANYPQDITIANVQMSDTLTQTAYTRRLLLLNIDQPASFGFILNGAIEYWADPSRYGPTMPVPREYFVVGCTANGDASYIGMHGFFFRSALMGCSFKDAWQHTVRFWTTVRSILAHNAIAGVSSDGIRHDLKLHANGDQPLNIDGTFETTGWASRHVVIANNVISDTDDNNEYPIILGPQNGVVSEGLEDFIVENNRFKRGPANVADMGVSGRRMTTINNTLFSGGGAINLEAPGLHNAGLPSGWNGPYFTSRD